MSTAPRCDPNGHFGASEHVRCRRFEDDLVMVDLLGGQYFALDAIGARMWEMLISGNTPAEVGAVLATEYEAAKDQIVRDCAMLVDNLLERGLLAVKQP